MKTVLALCIGAMIGAGIMTTIAAEIPAALDPSFEQFLPQFERGIGRFLNGDPTLWKQNASQSPDATIMGAWGAYEKGWSEASPRYDWAAARFKDNGATVKVEYLSSGVSGDLAYTVAIERSRVRIAGQEQPAIMSLRATHLFRKENGEWKMLHRHADPLTGKTSPAAVLESSQQR